MVSIFSAKRMWGERPNSFLCARSDPTMRVPDRPAQARPICAYVGRGIRFLVYERPGGLAVRPGYPFRPIEITLPHPCADCVLANESRRPVAHVDVYSWSSLI